MNSQNRSGQALIFVMMTTTIIFGLIGLSVDLGMIYAAQLALNNSTQSATLAGAEAMALPSATTGTVTTAVQNMSSATGGANDTRLLNGTTIVSGYPALSCRTTLTSTFNLSCYGPSSSNAVAVKQQLIIPTYFLRMFGANSFTLTSLATAAMRGAPSAPYNVAIIVDTTASMNSTDSSANCNNTRLSCALAGVQVLLQNLSPCPYTLGSCGTVTNGNVASSFDRVSLYVFPPVTTATVSSDYSCSGSVTTASYATPFPGTSTYQAVGFSSDYRSNDRTSTLNTTSHLVDAVKGTGSGACLQSIGGQGTYYAQAITLAQAALVAEKTAYPGSQNVMVILSDGDATATSSHMPGSSSSSGTYISSVQECHQAVTAAQAAATAGTQVYAVAYGSPASGCATDTTPAITPCQTMQQMASASGYFFSDYTATGGSGSCVSASQPATSLNTIFRTIAADLTFSRLIPNNTP